MKTANCPRIHTVTVLRDEVIVASKESKYYTDLTRWVQENGYDEGGFEVEYEEVISLN